MMNKETLVMPFAHSRTLIGDVNSDIAVHEPRQLPIRLRNAYCGVPSWHQNSPVPFAKSKRQNRFCARLVYDEFDGGKPA